jgi:mannonate dehydratase
MSDSASDTRIDRRDFGRVTLGAFGAAAVAGRTAQPTAQNVATIKLCVQSSATPSDEQLLFLKQLGAEYVSVGSTPELRTADGFQQIKTRYADNGITVPRWWAGTMHRPHMDSRT